MSVESELIGKIKEWQTKANSEGDPFDKYVSMFIAYNIFYNLYAKKKIGDFNADYDTGDKERAASAIKLADSIQLFDTVESDVASYIRIIPVFNEEYWPKEHLKNGGKGLPLAETLKKAFLNGNKGQSIDLLIKWLYKVRCNLVHGSKSYKDDHQKELLEKSANLLDKILTHLLERYRREYISRIHSE